MTTTQTHRLFRSGDVGKLVAAGRKRARLTQAEFARRLGISRKTLSDLERGTAEHVSLKTALAALSLAGYVLQAFARRPPTLSEVMAQRAAHRARADEIGAMPPPGRKSRA